MAVQARSNSPAACDGQGNPECGDDRETSAGVVWRAGVCPQVGFDDTHELRACGEWVVEVGVVEYAGSPFAKWRMRMLDIRTRMRRGSNLMEAAARSAGGLSRAKVVSGELTEAV